MNVFKLIPRTPPTPAEIADVATRARVAADDAVTEALVAYEKALTEPGNDALPFISIATARVDRARAHLVATANAEALALVAVASAKALAISAERDEERKGLEAVLTDKARIADQRAKGRMLVDLIESLCQLLTDNRETVKQENALVDRAAELGSNLQHSVGLPFVVGVGEALLLRDPRPFRVREARRAALDPRHRAQSPPGTGWRDVARHREDRRARPLAAVERERTRRTSEGARRVERQARARGRRAAAGAPRGKPQFGNAVLPDPRRRDPVDARQRHQARHVMNTRRGRPPYKLDPAKAAEIRQRAAAGEPRTQIADYYGISRAMVYRIATGLAWKQEQVSP